MNLTRRQSQIMQLILEACNTREIAEKLGISYNTVKVHVAHLLKKLGVNSRVELVNKIMSEQIRGEKHGANELLKQYLVRQANGETTESVQAGGEGILKSTDSAATR